MEMPVQVLEANPQVADDTGRVAVQRGPLVYCLEEVDQPEGVTISDLALSLGQKPEAQFQSEFKSDLLGGVVVLRHTGVAYEQSASRNGLYSRYNSSQVQEPQSSADVYSVLRMVEPAADCDAGVDSGGQSLMRA